MASDGDAGQDVHLVLRDAIRRTGKAALSQVVMAGQERAIVVMPMDRGLVAHTLHGVKDVNDPHALFDGLPELQPDEDMAALATQLIERRSGALDLSDVEDRYEARSRQVIEANLKGEGLKASPEPNMDGKVIDLMAALKRRRRADVGLAGKACSQAGVSWLPAGGLTLTGPHSQVIVQEIGGNSPAWLHGQAATRRLPVKSQRD